LERVVDEAKPTPSVEEMRQHIEELVARYEIHCRWDARRPADAYAIQDGPEIYIAPIRGQLSYAAALHEIGHIICRYQQSHHSSLVRERWSWQWARENALVWTPAMERYSQRALAAVERGAANDERSKPEGEP
jgi:hypothetical protein